MSCVSLLIGSAEGEVYDAERHLILGTSASAPILAQVHYTWYKEDSPHLAAIYASRSVLPYLVLGNLASATTALAQFTSQLTSSNPSLLTQSIDSAKSSARIFPSLPLLNFLAMLVLACQKGDSGLYSANWPSTTLLISKKRRNYGRKRWRT